MMMMATMMMMLLTIMSIFFFFSRATAQVWTAIVAIDRGEPKRGLALRAYALHSPSGPGPTGRLAPPEAGWSISICMGFVLNNRGSAPRVKSRKLGSKGLKGKESGRCCRSLPVSPVFFPPLFFSRRLKSLRLGATKQSLRLGLPPGREAFPPYRRNSLASLAIPVGSPPGTMAVWARITRPGLLRPHRSWVVVGTPAVPLAQWPYGPAPAAQSALTALRRGTP